MNDRLPSLPVVVIEQVHEFAELFGYETRNKYAVMTETGEKIGYAAEQQKGFFNFLFRQFLGHWRRFEVFFFTSNGELLYKANHPFRWFFERLELRSADGRYIGAIQRRFSILTKRFDVENQSGQIIMSVASPFWRIWTFEFKAYGRLLAKIEKKWAGLLSEAFTDKDRFRISFSDSALTLESRALLVAAGIFIDLMYFEKKAD